MTGLVKYRDGEIPPSTKGLPIPELSLKYNPFPSANRVIITSPDELLNGGRFDPEVRANTVKEFEKKFINIDFSNTQHLRLGFLWSAKIESSKGFGKTALLAHYLRKINTSYSIDLPLGQKVATVYVQPNDATTNLTNLARLICGAVLYPDPVTKSAILTDVIRTIRRRMIRDGRSTKSLYSYDPDSNIPIPETEEEVEKLTSPAWVDDWKFNGFRTGMKDYLLEESFDEDLAEILADYHEKSISKIDRWMKRKPIEFLFNDAVSLLKLAGFSGMYIFVDDLDRGIGGISEKNKDIFASQVRSWLFDNPSSKAAREGFFVVIMTFHPDLERALANSWTRSGLRDMASFDIDRSPDKNVELGLLDKENTFKLLRAYTEPAISDDKLRIENPLHPLTEDTALVIANPPVRPSQLLKDAYELIEQARRDEQSGKLKENIEELGILKKSYVESFMKDRERPEILKSDELEDYTDIRFG